MLGAEPRLPLDKYVWYTTELFSSVLLDYGLEFYWGLCIYTKFNFYLILLLFKYKMLRGMLGKKNLLSQ